MGQPSGKSPLQQPSIQLSHYGWLLVWGVVLVLSNRWLSWQAGITTLSANDVLAYSQIADAAPTLPAGPINFHHAQRFLAPYGVGVLASLVGFPVPIGFRLVTYSCLAAIVVLMHQLLRQCCLSRAMYGLCMGLLMLNPYLFRYYLLVPGMLPDVVFILGTAVLMVGLVSTQVLTVLGGVAIAAIGRQTTLFLLPGLWLWVLLAPNWQQKPRMLRLGTAGASSLLAILFYFITAQLVQNLTTPSANAAHIYSLLVWLASPGFSWGKLADHCLRLAVPLLGTMALLLNSLRRLHNTTIAECACLLMTVGVIAQPFLAGPDITGQNATRLTTLGLLPLITALALTLQRHYLSDRWLTSPPTFPSHCLLCSGIVIGSLHHLYTTPALPNAATFAALQLAIACVFSLVAGQ